MPIDLEIQDRAKALIAALGGDVPTAQSEEGPPNPDDWTYSLCRDGVDEDGEAYHACYAMLVGRNDQWLCKTAEQIQEAFAIVKALSEVNE